MAENTKIAWATHTFNPWLGCSRVSPACDHCYAAEWAKRTGHPELWEGERRRTTEANWRLPLKWDAESARTGDRQLVFCASLADVFDNVVPDAWRADLFELIRRTPNLDWLLLTKRIGLAIGMLPDDWNEGYPNVWLGATVVTQNEVDRDVPKLLATPARVRFLSIEPMLGPITLADDEANFLAGLRRINWVICGGESGGHARHLPAYWARDLRNQCATNGTAFFMKQGSQANWPNFKDFESFPADLRVREWPEAAT